MKNIKSWGGLFLSAVLVFGLFYASWEAAGYAPARKTARLENGSLQLIIDPGHGGEDGGAVSITGKKESEINLEIALRCENLAAFMGYSPVMTRYSEDIDYPSDAATTRARKVWDQRARVELINSYPSAALISIHQNKYTSAGPNGAQVFYNNGSDAYAAALTEDFFRYINRDEKRTAKVISKDIFLMNSITCPAVLVECGFVSNPDEAAKLEQTDYQKKLSILIIGEFCNFFK